MKKKITTGVIAAVGGMITLQSCNAQQPNKQITNDGSKDSIRLEERLKELSQTKYKGKLVMGAMCYESTALIHADFVCSYCGDTIKEKYDNWQVYNINEIEKIVEQIKSKGYDVILDKTELCQHCSQKDIQNPALIFKIRFSSKVDYYVVKSNIEYEYQCLLTFLSGQKTFSDRYGDEHTLNDNVAIIQKMTGLGKDLEIKK